MTYGSDVTTIKLITTDECLYMDIKLRMLT